MNKIHESTKDPRAFIPGLQTTPQARARLRLLAEDGFRDHAPGKVGDWPAGAKIRVLLDDGPALVEIVLASLPAGGLPARAVVDGVEFDLAHDEPAWPEDLAA